MEGCSKYCSFCVVPYTRGEEFSRPFDEVITEIYELAEQGVREVTLLGQNVNAYQGAHHSGGTIDFAELLAYAAEIDGIDRLRYTTSHPIDFSDRLIDAYRHILELVSHLHLPVQSGSDRVLVNMKRRYKIEAYEKIIEGLYWARPDLSLSSDFIVGFPGESENDFKQTLELIERVGFDHSFSFIYSARPGTPAATLPDDVTLDEKRDRLARLQALVNRQAAEISTRMVGTRQRVLIDSISRKNASQLSGRTENNRVVNFTDNQGQIGEFIKKSSVNTSGMIAKRYPWIQGGVYPQYVVQVHASTLADGTVLTGDGSQGSYIKALKGAHAECVIDVEDAGYKPCAGGKAITYIGTKKIYRLPYSKNYNTLPLEAGVYTQTKLLKTNCLPSRGSDAPIPVFKNNNSKVC